MFSVQVVALLALLAFVQALPLNQQQPQDQQDFLEMLPFPMDFIEDGHFMNQDVDGVSVDGNEIEKTKREKMPMDKIANYKNMGRVTEMEGKPMPVNDEAIADFMTPQPGVAPQMTGSVASDVPNFDYFDFGEGGAAGPVTNPVATYLAGADFEKVATPKCTMTDCMGPVPRDIMSPEPEGEKGNTCHQTFVPMNGCVDGKGYSMGMICTVCCDCTNDFVREMKKTFGYKQGLEA